MDTSPPLFSPFLLCFLTVANLSVALMLTPGTEAIMRHLQYSFLKCTVVTNLPAV
jgi:hypothetical protein